MESLSVRKSGRVVLIFAQLLLLLLLLVVVLEHSGMRVFVNAGLAHLVIIDHVGAHNAHVAKHYCVPR